MQRLNVAALVPYACMDSGWSPAFGKDARKTVYGISPVKIVLYMGEEKPTDQVEVPNFVGMSVAQANQAAVNNGLYLQSKGTDQDTSAVSVTYQDIEAGTMVDRGTTITVEFTDHSAQD